MASLTKQCRVCLIDKPFSEFYRRIASCKPCFSKQQSERYRADPDAVKKRVAEWKKNNKERDAINEAAYRDRNRASINARAMQRYYENKERQRKSSAAWRAKNKERIAQKNAEWERLNSDKAAAKQARRRSQKHLATPRWADPVAIFSYYALAKDLTKKTGVKFSVDHMVPLRSPLVCGLHVENNLQVIELSRNSAKRNRFWPDMPEEQCPV
jgi:hypothetical protein